MGGENMTETFEGFATEFIRKYPNESIIIQRVNCPHCEKLVSTAIKMGSYPASGCNIFCPHCSNLFHIESNVLITKTPLNKEVCDDMSCDKCSIMHGIIEGEKCPRCFYHEKSMLFLQMQVATN
jgi:hypothetical protein